MGLNSAGIRFMLNEGRREQFSGSILQLGRTRLYVDYPHLQRIAAEENFPLHAGPVEHVDISRIERVIDDVTLFKGMGFAEVHSCDYSNFEGADVIWDLNTPLPPEQTALYDVITDFGTSEHIFALPTVLANIHQALKIGGRIVHVLPASNYVDHGFYSFSPTLFADYYRANSYEIIGIWLVEHNTHQRNAQWKMYRYRPGLLDKISLGGLRGKRGFSVAIIARKTAESTNTVIPQQGTYINQWPETVEHADSTAVARSAKTPKKELRYRIAELGVPFLRALGSKRLYEGVKKAFWSDAFQSKIAWFNLMKTGLPPADHVYR